MWKKNMSAEEAAQVIERFLNETYLDYPGEWGDFVDTTQADKIVEGYRKRCLELDPLVNRPDPQDRAARQELIAIMTELRSRGE
jgi:hypothetical protein